MAKAVEETVTDADNNPFLVTSRSKLLNSMSKMSERQRLEALL